MAKKINTKDDFELCYLRHQYLRKTDINPTKEDFKPFTHIINKSASKTYSTYKKLFFSVGLEFADIVRVCEVHLTSYLGLHKIELDQRKFDAFTDKFTTKNKFYPAENDILDKNKANFTLELKHRLEDLVRICRQKVKNIRGIPMQKYSFFASQKLPELTNQEILTHYRKHGIKKVDSAVFRSIKKKAKPQNESKFFFNNTWYYSVPTDYGTLGLTDFISAGLDPRVEHHHRNPEELVIAAEYSKKMEIEVRKITKYKKIASKEKIDMLRSFVESKKGDSSYTDEVKTALNILGFMEK